MPHSQHSPSWKGSPISSAATPKSLIQLLDETTTRYPDNVALESPHQADSDAPIKKSHLTWTFSDLQHRSSNLAHTLQAHGLSHGTCVVGFLYNQAEWALLFWACLRLGCQFAPLDPKALSQPTIASHLLRTANPGAIFVSEPHLATQVQKALPETHTLPPCAFIASPEEEDTPLPPGWTPLSTLTATNPHPKDSHLPPIPPWDPILILSTSGTTSLPKLCPLTSTGVLAASKTASPLHLTPTSTICQQLPSFHIYSIVTTTATWLAGGKVIFPSRSFDPAASIQTINSNHNVYVPCVPSTLQGLTLHLAAAQGRASCHPAAVIIGGARVRPDTLRAVGSVGSEFRPERIFMGYGATESINVPMHRLDVEYMEVVSGAVPVGKLGVGGAGLVRVCEPGSREALAAGQMGEIHQGGDSVIAGYIGVSDGRAGGFYEEGGVRWKATGDQGLIDSEGHVYVFGRYDDMIIRGGENLSPATIEMCLEGVEGIAGVAVVGVPDVIAGEVPAAVVCKVGLGSLPTKELQAAVIAELGHASSPRFILDLQEDLGRAGFPLTPSGKIQKKAVRKLIIEYLEALDMSKEVSCSGSLIDEITGIWAAVCGLDAQDIDPDASVRTFADSVMLMQFLHETRTRNWRITQSDIVSYNTIRSQAEFLGTQSPTAENHGDVSYRNSQEQAQVSIEIDPQHLEQIAETRLKPFGLGWNDVKQAIPMPDCLKKYAREQFSPSSWSLRTAWIADEDISVTKLRQTLPVWLQSHPLLRTTAVTYSEQLELYLVMAAGAHWLKHQIVDGGKVADIPAVTGYRLHDAEYDHVSPAGPLFKITVLGVQSPPRAAFLLHAHHSAFDAIVMNRWMSHLKALLSHDPALPSLNFHSFDDYAKYYQRYRKGEAAKRSITYHVKRLQGISRAGVSSPITETQTQPTDTRHSDQMKQLTRHIRVPGLPALRRQAGISPVMIAKCACALVNVRRTGCSEALFSDINSGRSWPTVEHSTINPFEIDGPMVTRSYTRIPITGNELVRQLLNRVQKQQDEIDLHAHAPLDGIFEGLSAEDAATLHASRQNFNWHMAVPAEQGTPSIEQIDLRSRGHINLTWNPGLVNENTMKLVVRFNRFLLDGEDVYNAMAEFLCAVAWLSESEHLDRPISECVYEGYEVVDDALSL